jgi:CDP-2,3-bis-(O-geranylgeranyl)-sn-glycerol synthase
MAPVVAARLLPGWDWPVDFGCSLGGKRLLGSHKTWRGIAAGILAAAAGFALQRVLYDAFPIVRWVSLFDYAQWSPLFGAWMGLGALCGDLAKSLVKRRLAIAPGRSWFPFDQTDWLVGTLAFCEPFLALPAATLAGILLAGLLLHVVVKLVGYLLRIDRSWI